MLDDHRHLLMSRWGSNRYLQFATFGPNLRAESVGDVYLEDDESLSVADRAWLIGHGWETPDHSGNYWRHWEPAHHLAAATAALVTLHAVHGVVDLAQLDVDSNQPQALEPFLATVRG